MTTPAYQQLITRVTEAHLLGATQSVLDWDQQTMAPRGGRAWRARQLKQLARLGHEMQTAPELGELLAACEAQSDLLADPHSDSAANLREIRRSYDRVTRLPASLVVEIAETQSLAQNVWAEAREADDFDRLRPWLEKMVDLMRNKARCLAAPGQEDWDVLAEAFEPGVRASELTTLFAELQAQLTPLLSAIVDRGKPPSEAFHQQPADHDDQERFVRRVAEALGFDFNRGRLDRSAHPFCSGSHRGDVRITTRFHDAFVADALGSTMHEAGHGIYEQGLPEASTGTPLGQARSLGLHESQSRLWENHVGRSLPFWNWCRPLLIKCLGQGFAGYSAAAMYRATNRVRADFIRVEADEATYNLHVIVRFELELALIRGDLEVADLPAAWAEGYRRYLGVEVPDDRRGCLQDVHWACGLFGYFPTYTLGNLYAAQLFEAAQRGLPGLESQLEAGDFSDLRNWLNVHVHQPGSRYPADELCRRVTGSPLSMAPLMRHLSAKLRPIYQL